MYRESLKLVENNVAQKYTPISDRDCDSQN